jgi:peptide subunit release factor 1 (eRF1)
VLSLYLDLTPNDRGRDDYHTFVQRAFADRVRSLSARSASRVSFERDASRIERFLAANVRSSTNGLAIFACDGDRGFFEALPLEAPVGQHWLFVGATPHLYPLLHLVDRYPRYAAVVLDTHQARIFVFGLNAVERTQAVIGEKTKRNAMGGWSQARYQRHTENVHLHHIREVVDALDRIVAGERLAHIVVVGDETATPILRAQLPPRLAEKLVDVIRLDRSAGPSEVLHATLETLRGKAAETDVERVEQLFDAWRSGGLGVAGPEAALHALGLGQIDELLITGTPAALKPVQRGSGQRLPESEASGVTDVETSDPHGPPAPARLELADELVRRAQQTGARIRFIESPDLLAEVGGVAGFLRFRL